MTRVIRFHQTGGPEVQKIEELPLPPPGPGQVQIRVQAIGVNRSDLLYRAGLHPLQPVMPSGNGSEASGVVVDTGAGVSGFAPGERVTVVPRMAPEEGTYAEVINMAEKYVMKATPWLSTAEEAAFWASFLTAYGGLIDAGGLVAGDFVVLPAASSTVGLAAIQIANAIGATPLAVTRSASKAERLREAGAARVIVSGRDDLAGEIIHATGGRGARVVFDPVGGEQTLALAEGMARGGRYVLYGAMGGQTPFPVMAAFDKLITMGVFRLDYGNRLEELPRGRAFLENGLAKGLLHPVIDRTFPFEAVVEAHRYVESDRQFGKVVLTLD